MKFSRTRGLNVLAAFSAAFLIGCGGGGSDSDVATYTDTSSYNPQEPVSDWQLVWSDEFNGSQINTRNWTLLDNDCAGGGNNEKQCYTTNPENAFVDDGILNIVALRAAEDADKDYTSARMHSKNKADFKYGRFEIKAKMPSGQGSWPAIWMMPTDAVYGGWPHSGEIDIVEAVNLKTAKPYGGIDLDFSAGFDGATVLDGVYTFPSDAQPWAGFSNSEKDVYPIKANDGTVITFTGSVPNGADVDVRFRFEADPYPDTEPSFNTEVVTVSGDEPKTYTLCVPAQGENTFNSFLMYLDTRDVGVSVSDVAITDGVVCGESENRIYGTLHYGAVDANNNHSITGKSFKLPDGINPADGFHTYALEWNEGEMRWYVDDYLYATQRSSDLITNSKGQAVNLRHKGWYAEYHSPVDGEMAVDYSGAPFDQSFHLIMNLAVGGNWPESANDTGVDESAFIDGQTLMIDYVRVYECSINPETGKGCETVRAGYDMLEDKHPEAALLIGDAPVPEKPKGPSIENLTIFGSTPNPNWAAWDCCGGSTPDLVPDVDRGDVYQFEIGAEPTVVGFISRSEFLEEDGTASPFDASLMDESGSLSFDLKVITPTADAATDWKMKIESDNGATALELSLTDSVEGAAPSGEWQTFTYNLSDLQAGELDLSAIDVVMVFPAWGEGNGAVFQLSNVEITSPLAVAPSLQIFADEENASWPMWDCCGGTTPIVVMDEDADHGASVEFTVVGETVLGFNTRDEFTDSSKPFDATAIMADGVLQFDLKVITPTVDAATDWKMKIESDNAATALELSLTDSVEGAAPSGQWQTYTYNISDLVAAELDASAIDVLMIFPAWGQGDGAVYRVDNVRIYDPTAAGSAFNGHVLFKDGELDAWPLWDCCGGSTPTVEVDDLDHGAVAELTVNGETVLGVNTRIENTDSPSPIDATALAEIGVLQFDLKVVTPTADAATDWKMKIESDNAATALELSLTDSVEGAAPSGEWQTFTYNLSDLQAGELDLSAIDVVMVFPAWGQGDGAVYRLDNLMIYDPSTLPTMKGVTIFENAMGDFSLWDCCGGTTPSVVIDDNDHGTVASFVVNGETVLGFNTRSEFSDNSSPYDASELLNDGYLRFEMKVTKMPADSSTDWKMKIESDNAATALELSLTDSDEGVAPELDKWQTYTYSLNDLSIDGLDVSAIDVVMVFPAWGQGDGAEYRIDNMVISAP